MADILQFPELKYATPSYTESVLAETKELLTKYTMSAIVLALFEAATEPSDVAVIMPAFAKIVLDNKQK